MKIEVIRHFDKLGRIVIPIDFRRSMGITDASEILVIATEEGILLKQKESNNVNSITHCECNAVHSQIK